MRPSRWCSLLLPLLLARSAGGQTPPWTEGPDVVVLRDGTRLSGRAVDVRLGDEVTLRLPSGELRVIRWTEVRSARGASFDAAVDRRPPAPAAPPAAPAATDPAPNPVARYLVRRPGTVRVRLESNGPPLMISAILGEATVTLPPVSVVDDGPLTPESPLVGSVPVPTTALRTAYLCTTPCTLHLPPGRTTLHVGGSGRLESIETLTVGARDQRVLLHSSSVATAGGGLVLALFGGSFLLVGSVATIAHFSQNVTSGSTNFALVGGVCLALGVAGVAASVPLLANARTGVARVTPLAPAPGRRATGRPGFELAGAGIGHGHHGGVMAGLTFSF